MYDLMQGVRVIEVAEHTFVPAAGMVLADWGVDVIKVERTQAGGDSSRHMALIAQPGQKRNGFVVPVKDGDATYLAAASPGQFDQQPVGDLNASSLHGEHSDEVLKEIGFQPNAKEDLRTKGVIL